MGELRQDTYTKQCFVFHQTAVWLPRQALAKNIRTKKLSARLLLSAKTRLQSSNDHKYLVTIQKLESLKTNIQARSYVSYIANFFNSLETIHCSMK